MKFKKGDKVRILSLNASSSDTIGRCHYRVGEILRIECVDFSFPGYYLTQNGSRGATCDCLEHRWSFREEDLELVSDSLYGIDFGFPSLNITYAINTLKTKTTMKKLSNFYKKFTDEKVQVLVEMGYLNGDLEPTEKAYDTVKEIQFFANYDALVERAKAEKVEVEAKK